MKKAVYIIRFQKESQPSMVALKPLIDGLSAESAYPVLCRLYAGIQQSQALQRMYLSTMVLFVIIMDVPNIGPTRAIL